MSRVLIFRTGQLGDALVTVPVIHIIKSHYPMASLSLLYDEHLGKPYVVSRALLEDSGFFNRMIGYPVGYTLREKILALVHIAGLCLRLRRQSYDLVIHLEPELKTPSRLKRDKLFFRLAGIRQQITTLQYRCPRVSTRPLEPLEHESDFYLRALGEQGFDVPPPGQGSMDLGLGEVETEEVRDWLRQQEAGSGEQEAGDREQGAGSREQGAELEKNPPQVSGLRSQVSDFKSPTPHAPRPTPPAPCPLLPANSVGIGIGSKMQSKRWPLDRFRAVLQRLIESHHIEPVFFGGPEDAAAADQLIADLGRGLNACGHLSLRGSARALQDCRLYLGNDTGTMHLAVAADIPCVAIFSARDVPGKWYPYGEGHKVHRVPVDCEGCLLYECHEQGRKCLIAIEPEAVYQSCGEMLGET